jgi:Probable cobalt transporter subunit (CbtB)
MNCRRGRVIPRRFAMPDVSAPSVPLPGAVQPPPISLKEIWPWAVFAVALLMLVYFVALDEGALAVAPGNLIHEFVHDGRHVLGAPCH